MADIARPTVALGNGKGFHQLPAGKVRTGDIADLAGEDEVIERLESFFNRGEGVEGVEVIHVDVVGFEAFQGAFDGPDEVVARAADVVRAFAEAEGGFGGKQDIFAMKVGDGFAEHGFAFSGGIHIGGVEEVAAGFHAKVDKVAGLLG